jgi:hypothetical protein
MQSDKEKIFKIGCWLGEGREKNLSLILKLLFSGATTFSLATLRIRTLSITTCSIRTFKKSLDVHAEFHCAECLYARCRWGECRGAISGFRFKNLFAGLLKEKKVLELS